jgi:glycosyltransferase involved in cell wall biosynthesis
MERYHEMESNAKYKVLILSSVFPYPPDTGEKIRVYQVIESVRKYYVIDYLTFIDPTLKRRMLEKYKKISGIRMAEAVGISKRKAFFRMLKWAMSKDPMIIKCYEDKKMRQIVKKAALRDYDAVLFCGQRMALYRNEFKHERCIIDYIDAISLNMEREVEYQKNLLRKIYIYSNVRKMKRFEEWLKTSFTKSIITSETDKNWLGLSDKECTVIPICVDTDHFNCSENKRGDENILVFLGNMYYYPNQNAIEYFLEEIWPMVLQNMPDVKLRIIGKISEKHKAVYESVRNVVVTGYVDDIREYLEDAKIMIAPLRIGSGVASKILHSLALGIPVVCTSRANEGIRGDKSRGVFVEDKKEEFAKTIVELLNNAALYAESSRGGRRFIEDCFNMEKLEKDIYKVISSVIEVQK